MSGKQSKKEIKARKREAREAARRAERRRNQITALIAVAIILAGAAVIAVSIGADDETALEEPTDPAATPTPEATAAVPEDPEAEPGEPVAFASPPTVDDEREVACDAEEPSDVAEPRPQFPGGPVDVLEEGVDYRAVVETSCGTVVLDLLEEDAPITVNSFVFLAQEGFFDGLEVFRNATTIGALQTGSGVNEASWSIGYNLPDELELATAGGYPVGSVAMANAGPATAGSQFFFVYDELFDTAFEANRSFTVFAQVTEGLDVLEEIGAIETAGEAEETPQQRIYLESITIQEA